MPADEFERRLTAVLAADIVGFSRLMGRDEEGTIVALKIVLASVMQPTIEAHRGVVVKNLGDGVLVKFESAVDAVRCAVHIQRTLNERNGDQAEHRRVELRIGVNLADVIHDGEDIYGDGVNITFRIQNVAEPGDIIISQSVYEQVRGKTPLSFSSLRRRRLKNISQPVRLYRVDLQSPTAMPLLLPAGRRKRSTPSIERFVEFTSTEMERVNETILSMTGQAEETTGYIVKPSGINRIRPMLVLATALASGYSGSAHIKVAAAIEFLHTARLLHDDVLDSTSTPDEGGDAKRGWGNIASSLVGDFLHDQALKLMIAAGSRRVMEILADAAAELTEGAILQLAISLSNQDRLEEGYLASIRTKTAGLFAAACEVGPELAGRSSVEVAAFRSFGLNLGLAFQLGNSVLSYGGLHAEGAGDKGGQDFIEGRITMPVILAYQRGTEDEREFWQTAMKPETRSKRLDYARTLLRRHGALGDTLTRAQHYADIAKESLAEIPDSKGKLALIEVVNLLMFRAQNHRSTEGIV